MLVLDGNAGFGQTICKQAVTLGIERALERGVALVGVRNTGHVGRVGAWAELAAAKRLVSLHFSIRLDRAASRSRPRKRVNVELPQTRSPLAFPRRVAPRFCLT